MKELSIEQKAKAYDEAYKKVAIRFGSNVADEIFPELAESEDEKIRKAIGYAIGQSTHSDGTLINGVSSEEAVAWLEKKGEQKAVIVPKFRIGDTVRAKTMKDFVFTIKDITDKQYVDTNDGKYDIEGQDYLELVEQKPWSEEDNAMINETLYFINEYQKSNRCKDENGMQNSVSCEHWLKSLKDRVQPKQEWSEEDEKISKAIIKRINGESDCLSVDLSSAICWIKNVKDRVQPKQEWSEEDEEVLKIMESCLHSHPRISIEEFNKCYSWLKSLRPQNRWKPSDEQMENLSRAFNGGTYRASLLMELYQYLKKLK